MPLYNPRPDATYLITGGLSGLGLLVARQLVAQGARNLMLLGRSEPSETTREVLEEMRQAGAQVRITQADISCYEQIARVFAEIETTMPPLGGIIHSAGVLEDGALLRQDWPHFARVMAPKVDGSWILHRLTVGKSLDFFVLFSSTAALLGSPGQGNHAAANSFLDALAYYRQAKGLPALSINWGVWAEVGSAAMRNVGEHVELQGIRDHLPPGWIADLRGAHRPRDDPSSGAAGQLGQVYSHVPVWAHPSLVVEPGPILSPNLHRFRRGSFPRLKRKTFAPTSPKHPPTNNLIC